MLNRRRFLTITSGLAGAALASQLPVARAFGTPAFANYPFSLGVASGDPLPDGVVLWTRLAPDPFTPDGGMPHYQFPVQWKVCNDEAMTEVVREGTALATPEYAHSVHVDVRGLRPDRWYYYQFRAGSELSPVGRTRTAPAPGTASGSLVFTMASCQNFPAGYFAAYRHMAERDLDLVVHLGDYIYEGPAQGSLGRGHLPAKGCQTLEDYRIRYAQYKSDADLQAAHAAAPWLVSLDDHEVQNNWTGTDTDESFLRRRAAALQAYYENQPVRLSSPPQGPDMVLYRRLTFGDLASFSVLDTRQYRSDQPCGGGIKPRCAEALDPAQTMTGPEQERWLLEGLDASTARWNLIAQQTIMAELDFLAGPGEEYQTDNWAGYVAARERILSFLHQRRPANPVVLSGDIHATFVNDLKLNFADPASPTIGTELICTSITSGKPDHLNDRIEAARGDNPHVKFYNGRQRGYVRCEVTAQELRSDLLFLDDVTDPDSAVRTQATYVVESGRPGAEQVA